VLPLDAIPDVLPVIGFTDDAAVLATAIRLVAGSITPAHRPVAGAGGVIGGRLISTLVTAYIGFPSAVPKISWLIIRC
jgi:uncharacterized membrane protein YkvA (DUF1232 family)